MITKIDGWANTLVVTWKLGCQLIEFDPKNPSFLPLVFRGDEELANPDGMQYNQHYDTGDFYQDDRGIGKAEPSWLRPMNQKNQVKKINTKNY